MKCPYCRVAFNLTGAEFDESDTNYKNAAGDKIYHPFYGSCPECNEFIVGMDIRHKVKKGEELEFDELIFPKFTSRFVEPEVPEEYKKDFLEAAAIVNLSPKASAAVSRRLLQHILREIFKLKQKSLAQEIDSFLKLKNIPSYLGEAVDAVRNIGNFAAHPSKDTNTGAIVEVEPTEAEWLLEVLDSLFDFAFVQPERLKAKKDALNAKLAAMGKPPIKTV